MPELLYDHIIVRYGELSTKGKNRKEFTRQLTHNIKKRLSDYEQLTFNTLHDGLFIKLNGEDYLKIREDLQDIFGYAYFAGAIRVEKDIEAVKKVTLQLSETHNARTFKIATKRHDKSFPMRSDDINRALAGNILHNTSLSVDVHNPDLMIYIFVDKDYIYVMDEKVKGIGGYPTGVNGTALVMMSGGIDSPVAAYMTMKRGLKIECIHFASPPYTSERAEMKVKDLLRQVAKYSGGINFCYVPFTKIQENIAKHCPEDLTTLIMRRYMMKIAERIARAKDCDALITGESIGQVASQTMKALAVTDCAVNMPVFRPLIGMDKEEIVKISREIGTFEISTLPYEDCCTVFTPKHPRTRPNIPAVIRAEVFEGCDEMVEEAIENATFEMIY